MNITLHIERLILDGLSLGPGHGRLIQATVEAELGRLLAEGGLGAGWQAGGAVPSLRGGDIQITGGGDPAALGAQVAGAVYAGVGGGAPPPPAPLPYAGEGRPEDPPVVR